MVRRKITWIAEMGKYKKEFPTKKEAVEAENDYHVKEEIYKLNEVFRKYFKTHYGKEDEYDGYLYLCVDCGKKLFEYKRVWDGHRNERGDVIYKDPSFNRLARFLDVKFLDGFRCVKCNEKAKKLFLKNNFLLL